MIIWLLWGLASAPVTVAGHRRCGCASLERRDASQDAPPVDPKMLREMARREDWIPQNHMGSLVLIKPGVLRTIMVRAGHRGLISCCGDPARATAISARCGRSISRIGRWSTTSRG
jgi:hypothetical protein